MHFIFAFLILGALRVQAAETPVEIFKLKLLANISRCVRNPKISGTVVCSDVLGAAATEIPLSLSQCDDLNFYGKNCGANWKTTLKVDDVAYDFGVWLSHFEANPNFKYMLGVDVCPSGTHEGCAAHYFYLKNAELPYRISFGGERSVHVDQGGEAVTYNPRLELGEGAGLGL